MKIHLALAAVVLAWSSQAQAARDDALFSAVMAAQPAVVETLRELVLIESGTLAIPRRLYLACRMVMRVSRQN